MDKFLAIFAFAILAGFVLILAVKLNSVDLWAVSVLTLGLAGYDFLSSSGKKD